jgi:nucleotide-binding universal stress UspA family protein
MPLSNRHILIPVGSEGTFTDPIDYLDRMYPDKAPLEASLLHICSLLPAELVADHTIEDPLRRRMALWQESALSEARSLLNCARTNLVATGIDPQRIHAVQMGREVGTVRDICRWAADNPVDAVLVARRGRAELDPFFMKGITGRLAENCTGRALWIVSGEVPTDRVLVFYDCEANGQRAADHAGRMLAGTTAGMTLLHVSQSLRRFVPREFCEQLPKAEKLWLSNATRYFEPRLAEARARVLSCGLSPSQVDIRVIESSSTIAEDISRQIRQHGYGTVVLSRCAVPSIREFLQGIDLAFGREPLSGLAVWIV